MVDFWISVAFLVILLIPIAILILMLTYSLGQELRRPQPSQGVKRITREDQTAARKKLRVVK